MTMTTKSPDALLPCPICAGRCEIKRGVHTQYVMCLKCELMGPNLSRDEELIAHWNTLAHPAAATPASEGKDTPQTTKRYAGAIGLLCECSVALGHGYEKDELRDSIEQVVIDWCEGSGWTWKRVLHRIDVFPPKPESP